MMGPKQVAQGALFYEFSIEEFVSQDHPLRGIDRFVDLSNVQLFLAPSYCSHGRPSIDPELMIRTLLLGYCQGIRSEPEAELSDIDALSVEEGMSLWAASSENI